MLRYSEVPLNRKNKTLVKILGSSTQDDPCRLNIGGSRPLQPLWRWRLCRHPSRRWVHGSSPRQITSAVRTVSRPLTNQPTSIKHARPYSNDTLAGNCRQTIAAKEYTGRAIRAVCAFSMVRVVRVLDIHVNNESARTTISLYTVARKKTRHWPLSVKEVCCQYINLYSPRNCSNTKTQQNTSININKTKAASKSIESNDTL